MIDRRIVWFDGPAGAGKTTLIEHLLRSSRTRLLSVARFLADEAGGGQHEDADGNSDTRRFAAAGAIDTVLFRHSAGKPSGVIDAFMGTDLLLGGHDVLIEGPLLPSRLADLVVYVMRPLAAGEALVAREKREVARIDIYGLLSSLAGAEIQRPTLEEEAAWVGEIDDQPDEEGEIIAEIPDHLIPTFRQALEGGLPVHREQWWLHRDHECLADAGAVVINIRDESERAGAEDLSRDIHRLRRDARLFRDILHYPATRRPIGVFIANLDDPADPELKKAIARIKRALPPRAEHWEEW